MTGEDENVSDGTAVSEGTGSGMSEELRALLEADDMAGASEEVPLTVAEMMRASGQATEAEAPEAPAEDAPAPVREPLLGILQAEIKLSFYQYQMVVEVIKDGPITPQKIQMAIPNIARQIQRYRTEAQREQRQRDFQESLARGPRVSEGEEMKRAAEQARAQFAANAGTV